MASSALATAFVNIVPGTQQLESYLKTGIAGPAGAAGTTAGTKLGGGMLAGAKKFVAPLAAALTVTSLVHWGETTIKSLARIETISAQTASALEATGAGAWTSVKQVDALATSLENLTGTEAESIQQGANLLLTFKNVKNEAGEGNDIFNQSVTAMTDMARAMGTDASSGAIQLGKALNDPTAGISALTRVGVTFSDEQKAMIKRLQETGDMAGAQKIILAELNSEFGGSGAAYAQTYAGKLELMKHSFGTMSESILSNVMPALTGLVTNATPVFNLITANLPIVAAIAGAFALGALAISAHGLALAITAAGGLTAYLATLPIVTAAQWLWNAALSANPITLVVIAIAALVAGLIYFFTQTELGQAIWQTMVDAISTAVTWLWETVLKPIFDFIGAAFKILWDYFLNPIITLWLIAFALIAMAVGWLWDNAIKPALSAIGKFFGWVWTTFIKPFVDVVVGAFELVGGVAEDIFGSIAKWVGDAFNAIVGVVRGPVNFIIDILNAMITGLNMIKIEVPDWVPILGGQTLGFNIPKIPKLAKGGFVDQPTTALIGEAGPEVVTPLKDFERMMGIDGNGGGKTINYYAAPNNSLDAETALFDAIKRAKVVANW
jgi:hypothetical protein